MNFPLLLLGRFDQQGGEAGVIDAAGVCAVGFVADQFGHHRAHFFGNRSDFVLAGFFQVVGNAAQLLGFFERVDEWLDVGLPAARAESSASGNRARAGCQSRACGYAGYRARAGVICEAVLYKNTNKPSSETNRVCAVDVFMIVLACFRLITTMVAAPFGFGGRPILAAAAS